MKKILAVILALTMVPALAACGAAPTTAEPAPEAPDPLKSEMPSKIYEESAAANPEGKTVNILLVIDMQKDFVDQALGTAEAQAIVPNVVAKINEYKERGDVIIATKDTHEESYLETQEGVNLPFIHCVQDTEGWQLDDAVQAAMPENATIVNKPTFGSTDLVEIIGEYVAQYGEPNVHVEIIGLCTDICVISNALLEKAFYPEMPITLDASCCAGVTPAKHDAAIETMKSCQIGVYNDTITAPLSTEVLKAPKASEIYAHAEKVNPEGKTVNVLLVIDMQKDFVDQALGTAEAQAIVPAVVAKINEYKARGDVIIATRDTHEDSYMDTQEGKNLPVIHCVEETDGWLLNTEVADALGEYATVINKPTFGSTDLVALMREYVQQYGQPNVNVEIIGLCTDICVVSNALIEKAFYPEMPITLDASCCAGVTPATHDAAIATMRMCQINVINAD